MDNEGNYIEYGDLLLEMALAGNPKVTESTITLSNKTADVGGDIYDFVKADAGDQDPGVGDVVVQAGYTDCIIGFPTATKIQIVKTGAENPIANGPVSLLHSDDIPKKRGEDLIKIAMQLIDEQTGQYFNKRSGTYIIEGENMPLMHLPVPIIEITQLLINADDTEVFEDDDFTAFKGRQRPADDRRNPRIKLNVNNSASSIFTRSLTSRTFLKGTLSRLTGAFGFLEPDGSTPALIQRATLLIAMKEINNPIGEGASATQGTGPLKRLKVDLHEQEFFEEAANKDSSRSSSSGDAEIDRIVAMYRTPIRIKGSFQLVRANEDGVI